MSDKATELEQCKYKPPYDAKPMRMLRHHIECDCLASRRSVLREIEDLFSIELIKRDERIDELESELNPDGLPVGLTISEDGELLNWRGENYVKQSTLWSGTLTAEQVRETVEKHWHDLPDEYDMPEATALPEYSYDWQAIADELNAELGSGTCEVECFDDGVDEGLDGEWFSYAPPTWYLSCGHTAQGTERPNFCPVCGKAVKR